MYNCYLLGRKVVNVVGLEQPQNIYNCMYTYVLHIRVALSFHYLGL
jgi:hypothetical protein